MASHGFKHFILITRHRHRVLKNAWKCGIFFHTLYHDLSKYGHYEFSRSKKYFTGDRSPVLGERKENNYFSFICQHHTRRNPHHWEYWTDFYSGHLVLCTMPYKYATEYVCDMIAASSIYNGKNFKKDTCINYFLSKCPRYYITQATKEYVTWCLTRFAELGFKGLKKKDTKAKYAEITAKLPRIEVLDALHPVKENFEIK